MRDAEERDFQTEDTVEEEEHAGITHEEAEQARQGRNGPSSRRKRTVYLVAFAKVSVSSWSLLSPLSYVATIALVRGST
jgi:hypothetical protein